jgi:hypothetical protein
LRIIREEEVSKPWENLKQDAITLSKQEICDEAHSSEGYSAMLFNSSINNLD